MSPKLAIQAAGIVRRPARRFSPLIRMNISASEIAMAEAGREDLASLWFPSAAFRTEQLIQQGRRVGRRAFFSREQGGSVMMLCTSNAFVGASALLNA
mmetsp:Transcript_12036/g.18872  ORF Transcript_12036/g.18872 Transcript_12036/m.18872 type:complete len:98 (-) Transcript_12036:558-851(-)